MMDFSKGTIFTLLLVFVFLMGREVDAHAFGKLKLCV